MFSCTLEQGGGGARLALVGDVDLEVHRELRDAVQQALAGRPVVLTADLGELNFIDSTGWA